MSGEMDEKRTERGERSGEERRVEERRGGETRGEERRGQERRGEKYEACTGFAAAVML